MDRCEDSNDGGRFLATNDIGFQWIAHGLEAFLAFAYGCGVVIFSMRETDCIRKVSSSVDPCKDLITCIGEKLGIDEENYSSEDEILFFFQDLQSSFELVGKIIFVGEEEKELVYWICGEVGEVELVLVPFPS